MFACPSVGMWRANGNPNPRTNLDEILHTHPQLSKEGFGAGLTPFDERLLLTFLHMPQKQMYDEFSD